MQCHWGWDMPYDTVSKSSIKHIKSSNAEKVNVYITPLHIKQIVNWEHVNEYLISAWTTLHCLLDTVLAYLQELCCPGLSWLCRPGLSCLSWPAVAANTFTLQPMVTCLSLWTHFHYSTPGFLCDGPNHLEQPPLELRLLPRTNFPAFHACLKTALFSRA